MAARTYDSDDGEFIDFDTLADWQERDQAKDRRIEALEAALARADELAEWVYKKRHSPTNREDFYAVKIATSLDTYRVAREATK